MLEVVVDKPEEEVEVEWEDGAGGGDDGGVDDDAGDDVSSGEE